MSNAFFSWLKSNLAAIAAVLTAMGTLIIASFNCAQVDVMKSTLNEIKETSKLTYKPKLRLWLGEKPLELKITARVGAKEGDRLEMWYYVENLGDYPAVNVRYFHTHGADTLLEFPDDSQMQSRHEIVEVWPGEKVECGYDLVYPQQIVDFTNRGNGHWRHFFVKYEDIRKNSYRYVGRWKAYLDNDKNFDGYLLVEYRDIEK